jgi:hypothetical protein
VLEVIQQQHLVEDEAAQLRALWGQLCQLCQLRACEACIAQVRLQQEL